MIILKDNGDGTYLGADEEGNLFDGVSKDVGYDELTVETTITDDGFERVTSYGDNIISKGTMNKASFLEANGGLESAWDTEVALDQHQKAYYDVPPGTDAVEKTFSFIDWTVR